VDGQYDKLMKVVGHQFITLIVDVCVQHGGYEEWHHGVCQRQRRLVSVCVYFVYNVIIITVSDF